MSSSFVACTSFPRVAPKVACICPFTSEVELDAAATATRRGLLALRQRPESGAQTALALWAGAVARTDELLVVAERGRRIGLGRLLVERTAPYPVKTVRLDTLWERELGGRALDFVKIDVDAPWRSLGLEKLLAAAAPGVLGAGLPPLDAEERAPPGPSAAQWAAEERAPLATVRPGGHGPLRGVDLAPRAPQHQLRLRGQLRQGDALPAASEADAGLAAERSLSHLPMQGEQAGQGRLLVEPGLRVQCGGRAHQPLARPLDELALPIEKSR